jgi:alpha-galactosidase
MYGVDATKDGAQACYDSLIRLYREWDVDFIKVDDLSRPYAKGEIELLRSAIDRISPKIVLSTSPGETPIAEAEHVKTHANMWRLSDDFWDRWDHLHHAFDLAARWQEHIGPGHWPDLDMLPLGHIGIRSSEHGRGDRQTLFTKDEQVTMMTLWCMARSPLMFGGHLPDNDPWTLSLLTNTDVLEILKRSKNNRQARRDGDTVIWTADGEKGRRYLALFNLGREPAVLEAKLADIGIAGRFRVRNLWVGTEQGEVSPDGVFSASVAAHGAALFRLMPA